MSRIVSFVVLVAIALLVGVLSFRVMSSFLLPMFLALVLAVIFRPLHKWFIARCAGHDRVAAVITTAAILLIVLIPTLLILTRAAAEAFSLATEVDPNVIRERLGKLRERFHLELPPENVRKTLDDMRDKLREVGDALDTSDPSENMRQLVPAFRALVQAVHAELHLDDEPRPDDTFTPEVRTHVTAAWHGLDERAAQMAEHKPGTPEFASAYADVETAYQAFRESLLGSQTLDWIRRQVNPDTDQIKDFQKRVQEAATPLALGTVQAGGGFVGSLVVGLGVMIISLYYFLADGPTMIRAVMHLSPLDDRYEAELLNEFTTVSRAVVLATLLSAFAQGMLASIGYFFAGFESVFLLTVVTMLLAMIPFVGAAAVWGACSLWLFFYEGRLGAALLLATYGACVVSMIDNLIKPMVLHGQSKLHPLLALLSILGGIKVLGPIGIFVGPMGVAFLQALLSMVHAEIMALDDPNQPKSATPPVPPAESLGRSAL